MKVWDIEKSQEMINVDFPDLPQAVEWNENGSLLGTFCKDKYIRIIDPRKPQSMIKGVGFEGGKQSRVVWFDKLNLLGLVGFSKTNVRQYAVYDPKKFDTPIHVSDIDSAGSIMIPFYDPDSSVLFLTGKGDASIKYFEVVAEEPYVHFLSDFRDNESLKGACFLPKAACDTKTCEIDVCFRVMRDWISPVSFIVPRKSDLFQGDIYPDTYAGIPSMTAGEWASGANKPVVLRSMKPGTKPPSAGEYKFLGNSAAEYTTGTATTSSSSSSSGSSNPSEASTLAAALAKIKELEEEIAKLKTKQ